MSQAADGGTWPFAFKSSFLNTKSIILNSKFFILNEIATPRPPPPPEASSWYPPGNRSLWLLVWNPSILSQNPSLLSLFVCLTAVVVVLHLRQHPLPLPCAFPDKKCRPAILRNSSLCNTKFLVFLIQNSSFLIHNSLLLLTAGTQRCQPGGVQNTTEISRKTVAKRSQIDPKQSQNQSQISRK